MKSKVSVSAPWNQIYLVRNEDCENNPIEVDLSLAKIHDIQLRSSFNNQLYYPHQTIKFNLWKIDMDNNKEDKIGEFKFNSVNSDVNGWWSPSNQSWEQSSIIGNNTPTPTETPNGSFQPDEPTPTPVNIGNLTSWMNFESAEINVNNDDFHSVVLKNVTINDSNKPSSFSRKLDYTIVVWSIVKRSFDHDLKEAYICDHSDECGGIDSPDAYGYNDAINNIINNKEDTLSSGYASVSDFVNPSLNGSIGDLGFTSITKQSFMDFNDWRNNEELDLIVVFLTGVNGEDEIQVLAEDRLQLTTNFTYLTPTPAEFIEGDPTPTPTPFTVHDLSSWFTFDSSVLNVLDNEIKDLKLNNVSIDNLTMPEFLGRTDAYEIISYVIVNRNYEGSYSDAYESSSEMVYGYSGNISSPDGSLETFEDFYNLQTGDNGNFTIENFVQNYGIVKGNYEESFTEWRQADDVDLIVLFGTFDLDSGETSFNLEERFELTITETFSPTPTYGDFGGRCHSYSCANNYIRKLVCI